MTTPAKYKARNVLADVSIEILGVGNDNTVIGFVTGATGKAANQFGLGTVRTFPFSSVTVDLELLAAREG